MKTLLFIAIAAYIAWRVFFRNVWLAQHNDQRLRDMGYSQEQIDYLTKGLPR